jgi:hypothetical protein
MMLVKRICRCTNVLKDVEDHLLQLFFNIRKLYIGMPKYVKKCSNKKEKHLIFNNKELLKIFN